MQVKSATDEERITKLLRELNDVIDEKRRARFVCAMAISDDKGEIKFLAEGICNGKISVKPQRNKRFRL